MASHNDVGKYGEELAKQFFEQNHFTILHRNWKYWHFEIDIIASKNSVLHFIEVKTRRTTRFGMPEESVSSKKLRHIMKAAEQFMEKYDTWKRIQYDILSISLREGSAPEYFLIEDVYL